ncbi:MULTISPECIES: YetF domain-containing protein [unclassified Bacillus (in: firmicutes)]|uniref:DUF421 domain-containing protein n=1 Tax=unclassified Bacillus (in: firmicutes) TaxID=185979 RepID=UPI001BE5A355|nr:MULTISPECIES: YetF domain-containing protein [unclassified Bacillus (in: firmicutes)]MBT2637686.1 DUF421 domain-containing protein [Bacillus sp. ISL-39]MBT2662018.1 DUF421 domain-containing protein [Bacillus sp. ISL-45]
MFFNSWDAVWRTLIVGILAYAALVFILRISGKRTLSKMNAFDLIVTVALGSTLATILLNKNVALAEGISAFFILIALQYSVAWLSIRSDLFKKLIKSDPKLIYYQGNYLKENIVKERVLEVEILQAARSSGINSMEQVEAVVLETDGRISVIKKSDSETNTLNNVDK